MVPLLSVTSPSFIWLMSQLSLLSVFGQTAVHNFQKYFVLSDGFVEAKVSISACCNWWGSNATVFSYVFASEDCPVHPHRPSRDNSRHFKCRQPRQTFTLTNSPEMAPEVKWQPSGECRDTGFWSAVQDGTWKHYVKKKRGGEKIIPFETLINNAPRVFESCSLNYACVTQSFSWLLRRWSPTQLVLWVTMTALKKEAWGSGKPRSPSHTESVSFPWLSP